MSLPRFIGYYILYTAVLAGIAIALPYIFPNVNLLATKFWLIFGFLSLQGLTLMALYLLGFGMAVFSAFLLNKYLKLSCKS